MTRRVHFSTALCAIVAGTVLSAGQDLTHREADSMEQKLAAINRRGEEKAPAPTTARLVRTSFTEREVNAYFRFNGKANLPKGMVNPQVTMANDRRVSARAIVDLDEIRKSKERSWLDPGAYLLVGSVEVKATGVLQTANGKAIFQLESASVGSVPIPKSLLQELVTYYSRSGDLPTGFDFDKPFELPAKIREVQIQRGAATVIQQ
jgi:hypothetical protein